MGAYYATGLPKMEGVSYFLDKDSCIFEVNQNKMYKAAKNQDPQLNNLSDFKFGFGYTGFSDGISFNNDTIWYGN